MGRLVACVPCLCIPSCCGGVDCEDGTTDFRTVRYLGMYEEITSDPAGPGRGPKVMDQGFNFWGDGIDPSFDLTWRGATWNLEVSKIMV